MNFPENNRLFVASDIRFIPNANTKEFINVGIIAGRDDTGWRAIWAPERASHVTDVSKDLAEFAKYNLCDLTLLRLMWLATRVDRKFVVTAPEIMVADSVDGAAERAAGVRFRGYNGV